jgi:hypothetical protein
MKLPQIIEDQGFIATAYRVPLLGELFLALAANNSPVVREYDNDLIDPNCEICHIILEFPRWRAELEKYYFFITLGIFGEICEVSSTCEEYDHTDNKMHDIGNYFKTEQEARDVLNYFLLTLKKGI